MAAKLTRRTHKIAVQLHLVAESCTICSSRSRWPVWKLSDYTLIQFYSTPIEIPIASHCEQTTFILTNSQDYIIPEQWQLKTVEKLSFNYSIRTIKTE